MDTYITIRDSFGGEVRIPVSLDIDPPRGKPADPGGVTFLAVTPDERRRPIRPALKREYAAEFKERAVNLVMAGSSVSEAALALSMPFHTLDNWVRARRSRTPKPIMTGTTSWSIR